MKEESQVNNDERTQAIAWMREVLVSMLEACPLSYHQKKKTVRFLNNMPDWLMTRCADSLNIDYIGGSTICPDMAEYAGSDDTRNLAQQYLESHDAVAVGNCLEDLGKSVLRHDKEGDLPVDAETIVKQVYSLALAGCSEEGNKFIKEAGDIVRESEVNNHPVVDYHLALEYGNRAKLEILDAALSGGRYGNWAAERLTEYKRWLCGEPNIHWEIGILPDVNSIYEFLLKGG